MTTEWQRGRTVTIEWCLVVRGILNVPAFRRTVGSAPLALANGEPRGAQHGRFEIDVSKSPEGWDAAAWYESEAECQEAAAFLSLAGWKVIVSSHELELDE